MSYSLTRKLVLSGLVMLGACAGGIPASQTAQNTAPSTEEASAYSAALDEAFARYETEVDRAAQIEYRSEAELQAVITTFSQANFDWKLRQTLSERELTVEGLGAFASANPDFFHSEQRRHWGRLELAQAKLRAATVIPLTQADFLSDEGPIETASAE